MVRSGWVRSAVERDCTMLDTTECPSDDAALPETVAFAGMSLPTAAVAASALALAACGGAGTGGTGAPARPRPRR